MVLLPHHAGSQEVTLPEDTFADAETRDLVFRARDARLRAVEGIQSYEGVMRERIYVGLTAFRFRRERGLFEQERVARIRWQEDGERAIQWIAARQAVPIVGADTRRGDDVVGVTSVNDSTGQVTLAVGEEEAEGLRSEFTQELLDETELPGFAFDPSGDRLAFGSGWALHPLADTALIEYRYSPGDTLRVSFPDGRAVVLLEVRVEPRRSSFHLVAGSLWFDAESAALVRASYKPSRPFDLAEDEPGDAEDVPGFLKPIEVELTYATVEYSLHDFQFWLPRRFATEGEARVGRFLTIPVTVEWSVRDYRVNDTVSSVPLEGPLPPGWERKRQDVEDEDGEFLYVMTTVVPAPDQLLRSPELTGQSGERSPAAFSEQELQELTDELQSMLPEYRALRPTFAWGIDQGLLRFNRVEGLSLGGAVALPLSARVDLDARARLGTGDREPYGALALSTGTDDGRWEVSGYRSLESAADDGDPFSTTSSAVHLLMGIDRGVYYRATGAFLRYQRIGDRTRTTIDGFVEKHAGVERTTDFFLLDRLVEDTVDAVRPAVAGRFNGARAVFSWFAGIDPNALVLTGRVAGEAAGGARTYQRLSASMSATHPLPLNLAGALEVSGGTTWGDAPPQRDFFLGGSATLRGLDYSEFAGDTFWRLRGEIGTGFAGARLTLFTDMGWAGTRDDMTFSGRTASVGIGSSLLDGIVRMDVAKAYYGSRWKIYFYLDGLF
jgi:hypothetical protein